MGAPEHRIAFMKGHGPKQQLYAKYRDSARLLFEKRCLLETRRSVSDVPPDHDRTWEERYRAMVAAAFGFDRYRADWIVREVLSQDPARAIFPPHEIGVSGDYVLLKTLLQNPESAPYPICRSSLYEAMQLAPVCKEEQQRLRRFEARRRRRKRRRERTMRRWHHRDFLRNRELWLQADNQAWLPDGAVLVPISAENLAIEAYLMRTALME